MEPVDRLRGLLDQTVAQRPVLRASDEVRRRLHRPRARRLTFAYDESGLRLISHADRLKPAPPSERIDPPIDPRSVVAELLTPDGEVVYRQRIAGAFPTDVEIPDPELGMRRASMRIRSGTLSVIVPIRRRASEVTIVSGADVAGVPFETDRARAARGEPTQLGRFPLNDLPPAGGV